MEWRVNGSQGANKSSVPMGRESLCPVRRWCTVRPLEYYMLKSDLWSKNLSQINVGKWAILWHDFDINYQFQDFLTSVFHAKQFLLHWSFFWSLTSTAAVILDQLIWTTSWSRQNPSDFVRSLIFTAFLSASATCKMKTGFCCDWLKMIFQLQA